MLHVSWIISFDWTGIIRAGSYEQSPRMMNMNEFRHHENLDTEFSSLGPVESQLREDLADAMRESPLISGRDTTGRIQSKFLCTVCHLLVVNQKLFRLFL